MLALDVQNISKQFTKTNGEIFMALNGVNITIEQGQIYGLLGPNGAGKSTLINIISGTMEPTQGSIKIFGIDMAKNSEDAKAVLGIVPQEITIEPAFTVEEVLYYFGGMYGLPKSERSARITEVLIDLDLIDKKNEKARSLSGGMKRRLMIAKAILHKPKLLILDEPTAGVDVTLRQKIWQMVRRINKEGMTIIFTTHYLEEAEQLCEAVTFINRGQVIKQGNLKNIQQEFTQNVIHFELFNPNDGHLPNVKKIGTSYQIPFTNLSSDMTSVINHYGSNLKSIKNEHASLEQIFLELTNK